MTAHRVRTPQGHRFRGVSLNPIDDRRSSACWNVGNPDGCQHFNRRLFGLFSGRARGRARGQRSGGWQSAGGQQLAAVVADQQVVLVGGDREVERGGDVLVGAAVGHRDRTAEDPQLMVGADEADELDLAAARPAGGELGERPWGSWLARHAV